VPGQHIFVSYSRKNRTFVEQLVSDLRQAGIDTWLDTTDLIPGTPNWEQAIRDAISNASIVILVASADSRLSTYVQGEITLAKSRKCPIYPLWIDGKEWIECVPLEMVNYQYTDCRANLYSTNLPQIIDTLNDAIKSRQTVKASTIYEHVPGNYFSILLPSGKTIYISMEAMTSMWFLDVIYLRYLSHLYQPFTYGQDWILINEDTHQVAAPWAWFANLYRPIVDVDATWSITPLEKTGFYAGTHWLIRDPRTMLLAGFAIQDKNLYQKLSSINSTRNAVKAYLAGDLKAEKPEKVYINHYAFSIILAVEEEVNANQAFIQSEKPYQNSNDR
jgi:hypothetical protein